jgi:hypothetical protein
MADKKRISNTKTPRMVGPSGTQRFEAYKDDDGELTEPTVRELPPELAGIRDLMPRPARSTGGIEVQLVHDVEPGGRNKPWRAAEVWTKNRIYGMDSLMICFEILERASGRPEPTHSMLGSRLGGGRLRSAEAVRFSYPYPLPGMEAMFTQGKKYGYTSMVERFVLRIRLLNTDSEDHPPTWEEIASRWNPAPNRPKR